MIEFKKRIMVEGNWELWSYVRNFNGIDRGFGLIAKNEKIGRCDYPIVYSDSTVAYDAPELLPAKLRDRIRNKASKGKLFSWAKDEDLTIPFDSEN